MLASFLFLLLGSLFGFVLLRLVKSPLEVEEQLIWGIPIGISLLTLVVFALALIIHYQVESIGAGAIIAAGLVFYYFNLDKVRAELKVNWHDLRKRFDGRELGAWLLVLLPWLIYTGLTIPHLLFFRDGNLIAGWINTWGDWAAHLRNSTFFANHSQLSLENPLYAGTTFHYPYLSDYLSGILQQLNLTIDRSLTWPTLAFFGTLPAILYIFGRRLTGNHTAGVIFTYIVLLAGGTGIWLLAKDLLAGHYFWQASAYQPLLYTDVREAGQYSNNGIWFMNFIMSELLPQRAFLMGLPIGLYVIFASWLAFSKPESKLKPRLAHLVLVGCLFGFLPLIHTHSFVALGLIVPVIGFYLLAEAWDSQPKNQRWRSIKPLVLVCLAILGPATLIGFLFLFVFAFDPTSHAFFHLIHWWTPQQDQPVSPILYWLRNAGPIIVLGCIAAFWPKQRFRPLLVAGLVVFIIANFISFQPWQFDNLKLLTYWYIVWALPIALLIATLPRWLIWLQFILVIMLTGAGLADSLSVTVSTRTGIQLVDSTGVSFAQQVQAITAKDPDGLIVAATNHDNPLSVIAGRRLYVGYEGWLWTYGIDASTRDSEVQKMYSGTTEGFQLIKDKNIHYLALGPQEESKYSPNDKALTGHFTTILQVGDYRLLAVRAD